jgi:uncharacterized circularly permuted ATP-grasp superfamily protein
MLGVRGLMRAWARGNVGIANAPGAGVADDKVVYSYVPDLIRYFLGEEPLLPNVPHILGQRPDAPLAHARAPAGAGGQAGQRIRRLRHADRPAASKSEIERFRELVKAEPAQLTWRSRCWRCRPCRRSVGNAVEPRHVDLRPFVLQGARRPVTEGGLTRVALRKGSLVVNSSQGGGSKDTWIVEADD